MVPSRKDEEKKILIFHHDGSFRKRATELVAALGYSCEQAVSQSMSLELLKKGHHPILISEIIQPQTDAIEFIKRIKARYPETDVLVIVDRAQEHSATEIMKAGSSDLISEPLDQDHLGAKLYKIEREKSLRMELYWKSITDELTGLYNRRFFFTKLGQEIGRAGRQNRDLSLIMFDVDGFKAFNDKYGHLKGDDLLRIVATIIQSSIRESVDSGFRYGGDEFTIILPEATDEKASTIGERIKKGFKETAPGGLTLSMGIAQWQKGDELEALVSLADERMYKAKREKKGRIFLQQEVDIGRDNYYIRCLNCDHLVHWAADVCENCLANPRKKEAPVISEKQIAELLGHGSDANRRRSPRVKLQKTFMYDGFQATIVDIAQGGVQIKTRTPLSVGQVVRFAFTLPDRLIRFEGKVVHTRLATGGNVIAGIAFEKISEDHAAAVMQYIEEKAPPKGPESR